jgi:hypothetical protein
MLAHLLIGLLAASRGLVARITDQRRKRAYQEDHFVAKLLEMCQLAHWYGVSKVQVAGRWIEATVDAKRLVFSLRFRYPISKLRLHVRARDLIAEVNTTHQESHLFIYGTKATHPAPRIIQTI